VCYQPPDSPAESHDGAVRTVERMYKANPKAQQLFAIGRLKGTTPFYFNEVTDCVDHQMKLKRLVTTGWVHSKRNRGEGPLCYRIKREAYRRVMALFADEIAEMEEEEKTMKEQWVLMPAPQDARVGRMINEMWENEQKEHSEVVAGW